MAFIIGNITGPLIFKKIGDYPRSLILRISNPYFKNIYSGDYTNISVLKSSIISNVFLILSLLLFSLFKLGEIAIPVLISLKGCSIGFTVGFLINNYGASGFFISLLGIYPQNLFIILGIICIGAVSMSLSNNSKDFRARIPRRRTRSYYNNDYFLLILTYSIIVIIGSIIEGVLSPGVLNLILKNII